MSSRNGAKKRGAQPRQSGGGGGGRWPFFFGGLFLGLLAAGGIYLLKILPTAMELREKAAAEKVACEEAAGGSDAGKRAAGAAKEGNATAAEKPVTFEFYSMLPKQEVVPPVNGTQTTSATPPPVPAAATSAAPDKAAASGPRFLLQAGSFRTRAEADRRRGELVLSGHSASVQEGLAGGSTAYRVMLGPFNGEAEMQKAKQQLAAQKIDTFPIRLK